MPLWVPQHNSLDFISTQAVVIFGRILRIRGCVCQDQTRALTRAPVRLLSHVQTRSRTNVSQDDANKSTSYNYVNSGFNISYADGSGATGDYATDTISLGGATIPGLQFGIGYQSTSPESVLGIGYALHEAQVILTGANPYPNLPELMVRLGLINSPAYSLWLNDLAASTGSLLFGGVNTEKYHGQLSSLPIQTGPGQLQPEELFITLTGVQYGGSSLVSFRADAALLDSGSSLIYLPDEIAGAIYKVVGAQIDQSRGVAVVPCSMAKSPQTLDFGFSGATISVPMSELVLPGPNSQLSGTFGQSGSSQKLCTLAIIPNGGANTVLGDPFLRSAYVVYDLANNMISIAQTNFNATKDRILEIGTGPSAVPDAVLIQNPVTATARGVASASGRLRPTAAASGTASGAKPQKTGGAVHGRSSPMGGALAGVVGAIAVAFVL